jgi:hypothetical protein
MTDEQLAGILKQKKYATFAKDQLKPRPSATDAFDEALKIVTQERGKKYGTSTSRNFKMAADGFALVAECHDPELRYALSMIWAKMARLICGNPEHEDSWLDIAGYARTACMVIDERQDDGR